MMMMRRQSNSHDADSTMIVSVEYHVGNNISETYPRRIGQGLNDASCILGSMLSSLVGLSNPAWVSLGNHGNALWRTKKSHFQASGKRTYENVDKNNR